MKINLGYCCVSVLHEKLRCNRSSTKTYLDRHTTQKCHDYLLEKATANLKDLESLLMENRKLNIMAYRVPEQLLPQLDLGYYTIDDVKEKLAYVGSIANAYHMQLSTHPSQYFVLNSLRKDVVDKTIASMNLFARMFERMNLDKIPNIVLHVGVKNGYASEKEAIEAFCNNYQRLGEEAKKYLVVENDHVSFTVSDCLRIHEIIGIPVVFDNMHYQWNCGTLSYEEAVKKVVRTWGNRTPKFHLSSDRDEKKHAHAEYIEWNDYKKLVGAIKNTGIPECNIMLECKAKDRAVVALMKQIHEHVGQL